MISLASGLCTVGFRFVCLRVLWSTCLCCLGQVYSGSESRARHTGLWAVIGWSLSASSGMLPVAWGEWVMRELCSSPAMSEFVVSCAQICWVCCICVSILAVLAATSCAIVLVCWTLFATKGCWYLLLCLSEGVFIARCLRSSGVAAQHSWTPLRTLALIRTLAEACVQSNMEPWLTLKLAAPFVLPCCGLHLEANLCVLLSLSNLAAVCPSRCVGILLFWETLHPTYGPKALEKYCKFCY